MKKLILLTFVTISMFLLSGCKQPGTPEAGNTEMNVNPLLGTWERSFTWTQGPNTGITLTETFTFNADLTGTRVDKHTPNPPPGKDDLNISFTYTYTTTPLSYTMKNPPYTTIEADGIVILSEVIDGETKQMTGRYKRISDTQLKFTDYWYEPKPGLLTYTKK